MYQNLLNLFFTTLFLVLYTIAVNTPNSVGSFDIVEGFLFAFVFGFFFDEVVKMLSLPHKSDCRWKVGVMVVGFWNAYNVTSEIMGLMKVVSVLRFYGMLCLKSYKHCSVAQSTWERERRPTTLLRISCFSRAVPLYLLFVTLIYIDYRQLLYLDFFKFFGTMLIVLKEMLKESAVFFLLLIVIIAGFLQSFFG